MAIFSNFTAAVAYNFYDPILAPSLIIDYEVDTDTVSLVFMVLTCSYATGCIFIGKVGDKFDRRAVIGASMLMCGFGIYLSGGLAVFSLHSTIIGIMWFGFFYAGLICPGYAEIITVMEDLVHGSQSEYL